jgi:thiol-disulfide isomerase/thioredoxin
MNFKKIIPVLILLSLAFYSNGQQVANITDPRLQIKLPTVTGDSITLAAQKGKVILLDFWASWCAPCRSSNKKLVKLYEKYKAQGFEIFGVSLDEEKKDWQKAIIKDKIAWLQVNDPRGSWNAKTAADWNISVLPTSFLINKKGDVVAIDLQGKELEKGIKDLLQE